MSRYSYQARHQARPFVMVGHTVAVIIVITLEGWPLTLRSGLCFGALPELEAGPATLCVQ